MFSSPHQNSVLENGMTKNARVENAGLKMTGNAGAGTQFHI